MIRLALPVVLILSALAMPKAYAATWTGVGYWYKEKSSLGAIRYTKMTDAQLKALCTVNPTVPSLMPFVDTTKNMTPALGFNALRINSDNIVADPTPTGIGNFRVPCSVSHMSNDDPLVFPNQKGASHHHTFFGNTSTNYNSDLNNMSVVGNSTCNGGIMNRTAYWIPSFIDTKNNAPIAPTEALFYYKTGNVPAALVTAPPKGLRILAGNSKGNSIDNATGIFYCIDKQGNSTHWTRNIQGCPAGDTTQLVIVFPQCWDGVNLDSPDHKSHMAYSDLSLTTPNKCPATHPVGIPEITFNIRFIMPTDNEASTWRLSSDNYAWDGKNAGYSAHGDWVNGWNVDIMNTFITKCLNKGLECNAHKLGDGRTFY